MHLDLTERIQDAFSPSIRSNLKSEIFYNTPMIYIPKHLFKLSKYKNKEYGSIWVAYVSIKNPRRNTGVFSSGYIISRIDDELKIIGLMNVEKDKLYRKPTNWIDSVYNPSNLKISDLGEFIETERYIEPEDDGFSLNDYLEDK